MADGTFPSRISRNGSVNASGNALFVKLTDETNQSIIDASGNLQVILASNSGVDIGDVDVTSIIPGTGSTNLGKAEDSIHTSGDVGVMMLAVRQDTQTDLGADGDYVPFSIDADGALRVSGNFANNAEQTEDNTHTTGDVGNFILAVRNDANTVLTTTDGDYSAIAVADDGAVHVDDGGNSLTVDDGGSSLTIDGTVSATQSGIWNIGTVSTLTSITNDVSIDDGGNSITVDDGGVNLNVDIAEQSLTALKISKDANANSETNPIYVQSVDTAVSASEVHDFDEAVDVAGAGSSNHDYTVTGTTFLLKSIIVASSGNSKFEVQTGPVATLVTRAVGFITGREGDTKQITFDPAIEVPVTSTGTIRVIKTNTEGSAQSLYSTIIGNDV